MNRNKVLQRGEKPDNIASDKPITKREWTSASRKSSWKNPIKEGEKYLDCLTNNLDFKHRDVAEKFGVSKARVSQMIALVKKLPQEIINSFYNKDNLGNLRNFTERKLRPLTFLESDEKKMEEFIKLLSN